MSVVEVDFPGNIASVATIADLRALPSSGFLEADLYIVRGKGVYTWDADSLAIDDSDRVLRPADRTPLQAGRWLFGPQGAAGSSDNTYSPDNGGLTAFAASDVGRKTASLVGIPGVIDGRFNWTLGNFTGQTDGANVFASTNSPLTVGAWVRQQGSGVSLRSSPAAPIRSVQQNFDVRAINMAVEGLVNGTTDDSAAFLRALTNKREIIIPGRMYINTTITLPERITVTGFNPELSAIVLGPNGRLIMQGPGFSNPNSVSSLVDYGRSCFRNIAIVSADNVGNVTTPNVVFTNCRDVDFTNVVFYHIGLRLDNHRYFSFRKCRFYGDIPGAMVRSVCEVQPTGGQWINENMTMFDCFFSGNPVEVVDTVEPAFLFCRFFGGEYGINSYRNFAKGTAQMPFYMGPVAIGCTFDSIRGQGVLIEGGGINCRLIGNFFSTGRFLTLAGIYLANCSGVEIVGNRLEWCGNHGIHAVNCQFLAFGQNNIANLAAGSGYYLVNVSRSSIMGGSVYNTPLFGGSGNGNTKFAVETPQDDLSDTVIMGLQVFGMTDARQAYITGTRLMVRANVGIAFEYPLTAGTTAQRPAGQTDGYLFTDRSLMKLVSYNRTDNTWRDAANLSGPAI